MESIPSSVDSLYIFLILLPGFVTALVERCLAYEKEPSGIILVAKALVYSFINYTLFSITHLNLIIPSDKINGKENVLVVANPIGAIVLLVFAVALGIATAKFKNSDAHMKAARWLQFTKRTARSSIWCDLFYDNYSGQGTFEDPRVLVILRDGRRIRGWPKYFSDEYIDGPVLFLCNAAWVSDVSDKDKPRMTDIPNPGILLFGSQIEFVQLYKPEVESNEKK